MSGAVRQQFDPYYKTDFTSKVHKSSYPAISPQRPELSQAGNTVLVTGGTAGIGLAIARSFVQAKAATVVIVGRSEDLLASAVEALATEASHPSNAHADGSSTAIVGLKCDVGKKEDIESLWEELGRRGVELDVVVSNAARFPPSGVGTLMSLGSDEVWAEMETNVRGPLMLAEKLYKQQAKAAADGAGGPKKQKVFINVSTLVIHLNDWETYPLALVQPSYTLSKTAGTLAAQLLAQNIPPEEMQIVSFHPGTIYTTPFAQGGIPREAVDADDESLPGSFAVWAASAEAKFLHGRFVWASWDVEELAAGDIRRRLESDRGFLRLSVGGLDNNNRAKGRDA